MRISITFFNKNQESRTLKSWKISVEQDPARLTLKNIGSLCGFYCAKFDIKIHVMILIESPNFKASKSFSIISIRLEGAIYLLFSFTIYRYRYERNQDENKVYLQRFQHPHCFSNPLTSFSGNFFFSLSTSFS